MLFSLLSVTVKTEDRVGMVFIQHEMGQVTHNAVGWLGNVIMSHPDAAHTQESLHTHAKADQPLLPCNSSLHSNTLLITSIYSGHKTFKRHHKYKSTKC